MLNSVIITARWITAKIKKLIFEFLFSAIVYYLQHFYKYGSIVWKTWFCKGKTIHFTFICLKVKFLKLITSIWIESYGLTKIYVLKKFQEGKHVCIFFFNKFRYWWIFLWNHVWKIRFIVKFGSIFKSDCCFLYEGNVGPPLPCCEIKLADVEDMNYYAKDNKGEVSHLKQIVSLIILRLSVMDSCGLFCINDYSHVKTKKSSIIETFHHYYI